MSELAGYFGVEAMGKRSIACCTEGGERVLLIAAFVLSVCRRGRITDRQDKRTDETVYRPTHGFEAIACFSLPNYFFFVFVFVFFAFVVRRMEKNKA